MRKLCSLKYDGMNYVSVVIPYFNIRCFIEGKGYSHLGKLSFMVSDNSGVVRFSQFKTFEDFLSWVYIMDKTVSGIHIDGDRLVLYNRGSKAKVLHDLLVPVTENKYKHEVMDIHRLHTKIVLGSQPVKTPYFKTMLDDTVLFISTDFGGDFKDSLLQEDNTVEGFILSYLSKGNKETFDSILEGLEFFTCFNSIRVKDFNMRLNPGFICVDDTGKFVYYDEEYFRGRTYVPAYITPDYRFNVHRECVYQSVYSPLFISKDYDIVLGYNGDYCSKVVTDYLCYRVDDIAKFNRLLTKHIVLG